MTEEDLIKKLNELRDKLAKLEGEETEKILIKRLRNDMHDDFRENEGAKLIMEDHEFLHIRVSQLKREIVETKRKLITVRLKIGQGADSR